MGIEVRRGEFFSLLGPSGCGKTTTLRMVAGFEQPSEGRIFLEGKPVEAIPPYRRNVNTVFQSYALFEHLDVTENVAFGQHRRKVPKNEIRRGWRRPWSWSSSRVVSTPSRASCSAVRRSGWLWRAPSSTARRCCSWTSRSGRST